MTRTIVYTASTSMYVALFWMPLLRHMLQSGWRVVVASPLDEFTRRLTDAGIDHRALPISRKIGAFRSHGATWHGLYDLYRREHPRVVHHVTTNPVIYGSSAARRAGVPRIVNTLPGLGSLFTSCRWDAPFLRAWVRTAYRLSLSGENVLVTFQNATDRDQLVRQRIVSAERTYVIRNSGVDTERFVPAPEPEGEPVVLFCARMLWSKGAGDLVGAVGGLRERGVRVRLVLAGPADLEHHDAIPVAQLERWTRAGAATWVGMREDVPELYAAAHVVALPSLYGEGLPAVLMEAAASGRAIVCSDVPGCRAVVHDGDNGFVVPRGDVPALTAAIERLIGDRALRERMGRRGREIAVAQFESSTAVARTAALYGEPIGESAGSAAA